jgi:hypothetical protein
MDESMGFVEQPACDGFDPTHFALVRSRCFRSRFFFQQTQRNRFGHRTWGVSAQLGRSLSTGHTYRDQPIIDREEIAGKQLATK